ncbi:DUF6246 family protein [Enterobacter sp. R1(2018)]|uniref:DUF6246 family protein n=1 Tax=Enterobacter sp. R1(2018) TaxID=2447891 RepID=UPI000EB49F22|nr:DUF6246 family protein [Enterobacter sp. R1(2018)]RKQ38402.1 hypothetical protein D8M09_17515 [Enterobacter sp. R1(2018)]
MTPIKEIGECMITAGDNDYFFRPSFANMTRIGEPAEIVNAFYHLHNDEFTRLITRAVASYGHVPSWLIQHISRPQFSKQAVYAAMSVLHACCDDDISSLTGYLLPGRTGKWAFVYRAGEMPLADMVLIAQSLITHGVIGKAKVRKLQRHESGETTNEFRAVDYIVAAQTHFGMGEEEASRLTMTKFQMMLAAKYPDQKGFTREEYDQVADDYLAKKARRLAKAA